MATVAWGILGCGSIATRAIAPAIHWAKNGRLIAVASRTREVAERKGREVNAPKTYGSYAALLDDTEVDAVYIGLPNGLVEGFMHRHHPQWRVIRERIASGAIFAERVATGVDRRSSALLDFGEACTAFAHGSLVDARREHLSVEGEQGRIEIEHPFAPRWDETSIRIVRGRDVETIVAAGANHFLHQVEHFSSRVADATTRAEPSEDGRANVAACALVEASFSETSSG